MVTCHFKDTATRQSCTTDTKSWNIASDMNIATQLGADTNNVNIAIKLWAITSPMNIASEPGLYAGQNVCQSHVLVDTWMLTVTPVYKHEMCLMT